MSREMRRSHGAYNASLLSFSLKYQIVTKYASKIFHRHEHERSGTDTYVGIKTAAIRSPIPVVVL